MTEDDKREFFDLWTLAQSTVGKEPSAAQVALVFNVLSRFDMAEVRAALAKRLESKVYGQIQPGEIVEIIEGTPDDHASAAWEKVIRTVRQVGAWSHVVFDDPWIHVTIDRMGGWADLCRMSVDDTPYRRDAFVKAYAGAKRTGQLPSYSPVLTGHATKELAQPVMVGDVEQCQLTMDSNTGGLLGYARH